MAVRVLVIEDEERLAEALARGLRAEGFDVDVVHDGNDGLWRAREGAYAAVILDVLLPGRNGYAVCRTLREEGNAVPILMLTAKDGEYDEVEAFELGADDFLTKPFSFPVLVARLRALVRRGPAATHTDRIEVGDLVLDPRAHTCTCAGTAIELTPREYALLEALARRPGEVVPKSQLLDEVWGLDFEGDPNVLEVYLGYLRRKLDKPFGTQRLETVRGAGYRLARVDVVTAPSEG